MAWHHRVKPSEETPTAGQPTVERAIFICDRMCTIEKTIDPACDDLQDELAIEYRALLREWWQLPYQITSRAMYEIRSIGARHFEQRMLTRAGRLEHYTRDCYQLRMGSKVPPHRDLTEAEYNHMRAYKVYARVLQGSAA